MAVILLWAKRMDLTWSVLVLTVLAVHSMAVRGNLALASPDTAAPREPAYSSTRGTVSKQVSCLVMCARHVCLCDYVYWC